MYLLDTCVISDVRRQQPGPSLWLQTIPPQAGFLSAITIGEVQRGVRMAVSSGNAAAALLKEWLAEVRASFRDRILPVTEPVAIEWGRLCAEGSRPLLDTYIAATALVHNLVVVTRNERDFADTGVRILNPWDPA